MSEVPVLPTTSTGRFRRVRYILSCDGGGVRGAATAAFLRRLRERIFPNRPLVHVFDAMGGSSTGALITGALATGRINAYDLDHTLYTEKSTKQLFQRRWQARVPILGNFTTQYHGRGKCDIINRCLGKGCETLTMADLETKLMVPTLDMTTRSPVLWHNFSDEGMPHVPLAQILDASSAAPYYFPPVRITFDDEDTTKTIVTSLDQGNGETKSTMMQTDYYDRVERLIQPRSGDMHVDGGASTNTPCITLFSLAKRMWPDDDIRALSIGTSYVREDEPGKAKIMGNIVDFANTVITAPNEVNSLDTALLLGQRYLRIDGPLPPHCSEAMDRADEAHLNTLKEVGYAWFDRHEAALRSFFEQE